MSKGVRGAWVLGPRRRGLDLPGRHVSPMPPHHVAGEIKPLSSSLLGGAWSQRFPIIVQQKPQLLLKGLELSILCCLHCCCCCRRCLVRPGYHPSYNHRRLSCCFLHPLCQTRCFARDPAQGSEGCSGHCWVCQCSCLMTTYSLTCYFANVKPGGVRVAGVVTTVVVLAGRLQLGCGGG